MSPDLERLVSLQQAESRADRARKAIDAMPARREAIEARVAGATAALALAQEQLAANQAARRALDKDLGLHQGRLSKFKDQLMEVKTNKEYQAMQHEIATAQGEVKRIEDVLLERMLEADDLGATLRAAEASLTEARVLAAEEGRALDAETVALHRSLEESAAARVSIASSLPEDILALFERIRAGRGTAVTEARDGLCTACHVRLRPQVFNMVLKGEAIVQCDSCQRLLFYRGPVTATQPQAERT